MFKSKVPWLNIDFSPEFVGMTAFPDQNMDFLKAWI